MNHDIWIVTGISPEARSQARAAAERARMAPGEWVERAIRKSLFLDRGAAATDKPSGSGRKDHEVIRALTALEARLNQQPEWPATMPIAPKVAPLPAPPTARTDRKTDRVTGLEAGREPKQAPEPGSAEGLAALAADYPIPEEPARSQPALRVIALIAGVAITSAAAIALIHQSFQPTVVAPSSTQPEPYTSMSAVPPPAAHITAARSARSKLPNAEETQSGLQLAAAAGDAWAQRRLGLLYATGGDGKVDGRRAAIWLHRAAAQGLPSASFYLGLIYDRGRGVPTDKRKAFIYYQRAAQKGYAPAKHNVGVALAEGRGTKRNYALARKWFRSAASDGIAASHFSMGLIYELGLGAQVNLIHARKWYRTAATLGDTAARGRLEALTSGGSITLASDRFPQIAFEGADRVRTQAVE